MGDAMYMHPHTGVYELLEFDDASNFHAPTSARKLLDSTSYPWFNYDLTLSYELDVVNNTMTAERMSFKNTLPHAKLFYPEPFIASPSYLHSDLIFLNILQYWYWLWFIFVYLIVFFFLSFLTVVRWCSTHRRPSKETRGVSRSKCGDLITACVPVSWAVSIIISESTDSSDINDGFGTGEIVIGVRAYQWGWEYYYPRSIDLLYNTTPSYSSFVGNSLKYNPTSGTSADTNNFWRQYQVKNQDAPTTPASLVFNTLSSVSAAPQSDFSSAGVRTLQLSASFPRIRNNTKVYNTHLVGAPSGQQADSYGLASLYAGSNASLESIDYGIRRPSSLISSTALIGSPESSIDRSSFTKFLQAGLKSTTSTSLVDNSSLANESSVEHSLKDAVSLGLSSVSNGSSSAPHYSNSPSTRSTLGLGSRSEDFVTSKDFLDAGTLSDSTDKILPTDQTISQQGFVNPQRALDFYGTQSLVSGSKTPSSVEASLSSSVDAGWSDFKSKNVAGLSNRLFTSPSLAPVTSSSADRNANPNSLFDGTVTTVSTKVAPSHISISSDAAANLPIDSMVGAADKVPTGLLNLYWSSCWSNLSPEVRTEANEKQSGLSSSFYLPLFNTYADYDFRNEQSILLLEDLLWEAPYSTFSFYDYLALGDSCSSKSELAPVVSEMEALNKEGDTGLTTSVRIAATPSLANIQSDEVLLNYRLLSGSSYASFPLLNDLSEQDDQYSKTKSHAARMGSWENNLTLLSDSYSSAVSYIQVFNHFPSTFEDYSWVSSSADAFASPEDSTALLNSPTTPSDVANLKTSTSSSVVATDHLQLRPSVRDSIVNNNAFQKVFRSRLDEGRAHANASHFSNLAQGQPFIGDYGVPYTDLLGKNRTSYFATQYYPTTLAKNFNTLSSLYSLSTTQMFEFPFMDAVKSDLIRYTWMDGYSKWVNIDVQPASVSRYSTIGVPYLRKAYDFNAGSGDSFSEVQTYFTRSSRNRKNYLPNWTYSPLLLNRQLILNNLDGFMPRLSPTSLNLSSFAKTLDILGDCSHAKLYSLNHLKVLSASNSGMNVYGRSTWRPQTSIANYYYGVSTFVDLLSRREMLIRDYWFNQKGTSYIPKRLTASPQNPILKEVIAAFALHDPLTFSSEASRDYVYFSSSYFKFLYLKSLAQSLASANEFIPFNTSFLNDYVFFFFMNNDSNVTSRSLPTSNELYRSQFRPLRKGISSMLRLHSTGAVAMPIEMRLQILASSRDVIHSWSIPSASIKIDCVPGYTSHRIMKFMLTGIYWGQCQEICGRYHHWMPIVVYFINRDLFFLWCTHFIYKPQTQQSWEISDRKFANFVRFVSYDKSSWLSEMSTI